MKCNGQSRALPLLTSDKIVCLLSVHIVIKYIRFANNRNFLIGLIFAWDIPFFLLFKLLKCLTERHIHCFSRNGRGPFPTENVDKCTFMPAFIFMGHRLTQYRLVCKIHFDFVMVNFARKSTGFAKMTKHRKIYNKKSKNA